MFVSPLPICTQVNRDLASIFSTLLPGATAELKPPEGGNLEEGLELRVALGGVWKASLSELSGGQRSLLALSLVLALLLFKPAPMCVDVFWRVAISSGANTIMTRYILDEIDAP